MKLTAETTQDLNLIKELATTSKLYEVTVAGYWPHIKPEDYRPHESNIHVLVKDEADDIIGFSYFELWTNLALIQHFRILPKYWGKGYTKPAQDAIEELVRQETKFHRLVGMVPRAAKEQLAACMENGFKVEGCIKNSNYYMGQLTDMVIVAKDIINFKEDV